MAKAKLKLLVSKLRVSDAGKDFVSVDGRIWRIVVVVPKSPDRGRSLGPTEGYAIGQNAFGSDRHYWSLIGQCVTQNRLMDLVRPKDQGDDLRAALDWVDSDQDLLVLADYAEELGLRISGRLRDAVERRAAIAAELEAARIAKREADISRINRRKR